MDFPGRKPNRLKGYDYSTAGAYFVTICTEGRRKTLCEIVGGGLPVPKEAGLIAEKFVQKIPDRYPTVHVDHSVIMPNHIHLLLSITEANGTGDPSPTPEKIKTEWNHPGQGGFTRLKFVVIRKMLHNILHLAVKNIT